MPVCGGGKMQVSSLFLSPPLPKGRRCPAREGIILPGQARGRSVVSAPRESGSDLAARAHNPDSLVRTRIRPHSSQRNTSLGFASR